MLGTVGIGHWVTGDLRDHEDGISVCLQRSPMNGMPLQFLTLDLLGRLVVVYTVSAVITAQWRCSDRIHTLLPIHMHKHNSPCPSFMACQPSPIGGPLYGSVRLPRAHVGCTLASIPRSSFLQRHL